jgi:probable rRNA maturation factor
LLINEMIIFRKPVPGVSEASLGRFVVKAARAAKLKGTVSVLVTTSRELRALNRRFRGHDKPTDVLSFPPITEFADDIAGDIAISAQIAAKNARQMGHSPADEIKTLALHGVLHLAGYDHEQDEGVMAKKEESLRRSLRLPVALIQRTRQPRGVKSAGRSARPPR